MQQFNAFALAVGAMRIFLATDLSLLLKILIKLAAYSVFVNLCQELGLKLQRFYTHDISFYL